MKKIIICIFLFSIHFVYAQNVSIEDFQKEIKPLNDKIQLLQSENRKLKNELKTHNSKINQVAVTIQNLRDQIGSNKQSIDQSYNSLETKLKKTTKINNDKIINVGQSISQKSLVGIIFILLVLLISGSLFWFLSKKQRIDKSELEKEGVKLDVHLLEVIEKQLKVVDKINTQEVVVDHTFQKNSANELMRITNYANTLEPNSPEAIALLGSLENLQNYFKSSNYEINNFTGQDFDQRIPMKVKETIYDELLPLGKEIISRTLKPQIKYKGIVIQDAEVITKYNN
jgi:Tfp pilus assembly protein PilO